MQFDDVHNKYPIHLLRLSIIFSSAGSWFILCHNRLLLIVPMDPEYFARISVDASNSSSSLITVQ